MFGDYEPQILYKKILKTLVFAIAVIGSMTPSQYGLYNPKCPVKLKLKKDV